jgi:hypothetical protein
MILPSPGLVLNARPLDSILAYSEPNNMSSYPALASSQSSPILLIKPSKDALSALIKAHEPSKQSDMSLLYKVFPETEPLLSESDPDFKPTLYQTLQTLRTEPPEGHAFNASEFAESTAFLRLEDNRLPGPEYDVPYQMIVGLRPKDDDQGFIWEKMYNTYKDRRYRVCGLDLIDWSADDSHRKTELK